MNNLNLSCAYNLALNFVTRSLTLKIFLFLRLLIEILEMMLETKICLKFEVINCKMFAMNV